MSSPSGCCYIEFRIANEDSLLRLSRTVDGLAVDKSSDCRRDDAKWMELFTENELNFFWWPSQSEAQEWADYWSSIPVPQRLSPEMPSPGWDFASMIDAIFSAEYVLIGVRSLTAGEAILEFDPQAWPYGGAGALRALIRSFGHRILGFEDGTGYVDGDPVPPPWKPARGPAIGSARRAR